MSEPRIIKKPIPIRGLEIDRSVPDQLRILEGMQQTLALMVGLTGSERVPVRVDERGLLVVRGPDLTAATCVSGATTENTEVDLGSVFDYARAVGHSGIVYLDVGIATGVYPTRVQSSQINFHYQGTGVDQGSLIEIWGKFRYMKFNVHVGPGADIYYSAYKFNKR